MMRASLVAAVVLAAISLAPRPAAADYRGAFPWCAVYSLGHGSMVWDCQYRSVEACQPNVISGNRGFCNHNPAYEGPVEPRRRHAKRLAQGH
jgi:hypothetical protein